MLNYTTKEEYLEHGWIFKGTITFPVNIPSSVINDDDFSIRVVNPITFFAKTISNIDPADSNEDEISVSNAMIQDLGYYFDSEHDNRKIIANLAKNKGVTFYMTDNSFVVYVLPSYIHNDTTFFAFDMAQIIVTFRLNGNLETAKITGGILPSVRRSNNFTVYKKDPNAGGDFVFPDNMSRAINPEPDIYDFAQTSGYDFNEKYIENNISTSANFTYNETVDGLYIGAWEKETENNGPIYEASAIVYTPPGDYSIEFSSYLCNPFKGTKLNVPYSPDPLVFESCTGKIFDLGEPSEDQAAYFTDIFTEISGGYSAFFNSAAIVQTIRPIEDDKSMRYRLTLECKVKNNDE